MKRQLFTFRDRLIHTDYYLYGRIIVAHDYSGFQDFEVFMFDNEKQASQAYSDISKIAFS